jgi:hypothetical protein
MIRPLTAATIISALYSVGDEAFEFIAIDTPPPAAAVNHSAAATCPGARLETGAGVAVGGAFHTATNSWGAQYDHE